MYRSFRFISECLRPPIKQTWGTDCSIILDQSPYWKLLFFPGEGEKKKQSISFFPPHAGRHGNVSKESIRACQEAGFDTYVFELLPATDKSKDVDLARLVKFAMKAYESVPGQKIVIGDCQGAWLSSIVVALSELSPLAYFNFAGPIDFSYDSYIKQCCQGLTSECLISNGMREGVSQWWGFTLMNPVAVFMDDYTKLANFIVMDDEKKIAQWRSNHDWFWSPQNLAGKWYKEAVDRLFCNNELVRGDLELDGRKVDLNNIKCPCYLYAGGKDEITPVEQTYGMGNFVSGSVFKRLFSNCGHTAVFTKKEPLMQLQKDLVQLSSCDECVNEVELGTRSYLTCGNCPNLPVEYEIGG